MDDTSELSEQQLAFYDYCRANGASHSIAMVCATRTSPGTKGTDRALWQNAQNKFQFNGGRGETAYTLATAKSAGIDTTGRLYINGLGKGPADPAAWVADVHDIKRVCVERNLHCDGIVKHVAEDRPPPPRVPLAPDIVERQVNQMIRENPDLKAKKREDLRHQAVEKHSLKKRKTMEVTK